MTFTLAQSVALTLALTGLMNSNKWRVNETLRQA